VVTVDNKLLPITFSADRSYDITHDAQDPSATHVEGTLYVYIVHTDARK